MPEATTQVRRYRVSKGLNVTGAEFRAVRNLNIQEQKYVKTQFCFRTVCNKCLAIDTIEGVEFLLKPARKTVATEL